MWTATITEKNYFNGDLKVTVSYEDDTQKFNETYSVRSFDDLDNRIKARLENLEALDTFSSELTVGTYTPIVKEEKPIDPKQGALGAVYKAKEELELKLITQAEYDTILGDYKTLIAK